MLAGPTCPLTEVEMANLAGSSNIAGKMMNQLRLALA
jgi:hypothetical protein